MTDSIAAPPSEELAAARLVRRVLAQWPLILVCALIAAVAGYFVSSSRPKQYEATTTVQLNDIDLASVFLAQNLQQQGQDAQTKAATAAKLATILKVRQEASQALGGRVSVDALKSAITVVPEADTTLVDITATASSPQLAADEANAVREAFISSRQQANSATLESARQRLQGQLSGMSKAQRASLTGQTLESRLENLNTLILTAGAGVATAQPATAPEDPSSPRPKRDAILALILGGIIGLAIALLRARLDDRIRDQEELAEHWDLPVLGLIPRTSALSNAGATLPSAGVLEAFALTRTNLRYLHVGGEMKTIVVTSALAEEGKSTVAWNLALATAMAEQRVLLIEADLRRPVLAQRLGLTVTRGFSDVLAGLAPLADATASVSVPVPGSHPAVVDVVPAGFLPPSPIALLEREAVGQTLKALSRPYDLVIIDSPPATVVADAKVLIAHADGAVVVSRLGRVTRSALDRLREILSGLETPVLGTVVNSGTAEKSYGYASYDSATAAPVPTGPPSSSPRRKSPDDAVDSADADRVSASTASI